MHASLVMAACALVASLYGGVPGSRQATQPKPVVFRNVVDGYKFEVPSGWIISVAPDRKNLITSVDREHAGLEDGFVVRMCPGPTPEDCMGDDGMLAELVKVTDIRMAGHSAKEYTYRRQTVAGTRLWAEMISVLNLRGKTYGVIAQIPYPEAEKQYHILYDRIRESFQVTR